VIDSSIWSPSFGDEPIVSYSQNAEDIRLWRVFRSIEDGFYVDVGAADPHVDSVTCLFYENGWAGINVEPSPCFALLQEARSRDVNLRVAIGESEGSVPFFLTYPFLGMSTGDPSVHAHVGEAVDRMDEIRIAQRRLDSILREHADGRTIHFLKVDVEGAEHQVLASSDWTAFRPVVVVVESIASLSTSPTYERWEPILLEAGYLFATFDGINRFYVDREHDHLIPVLAYPMSALDRYVKASVRDLENEMERTSREAETLRWVNEHMTSEAEGLRHVLDAVYRSRTWRAGRVVATATRPIRAVLEHLPGLGSR
jgi:FkbM family methyltransferase